MPGNLARRCAAQDPLQHTAHRMAGEKGDSGEDESPEVRQTRWNYHSDYVNPFEFIDFLRLAEGLRPFDVMLEVRAKDLALRQLREDLARFAPELAAYLIRKHPSGSSAVVATVQCPNTGAFYPASRPHPTDDRLR